MRRLLTILFSILALSTAIYGKRVQWNRFAGFNDFGNYYTELSLDNTAARDLTAIADLAVGDKNFSFVANILNRHSSPTKNYSYIINDKKQNIKSPDYGLVLIGSNNDSIILSLKSEVQNNAIEDKNVVSLSVLYATPQGREQQDRAITNIQNAEGSFSIRISRTNDKWVIECGESELSESAHLQLPGFDLQSMGFYTSPGGAITVNQASLHYADDYVAPICRYADEEALFNALDRSIGALSGVWTYADREMEESLLRMGGNYQLAIVDSDDGYEVIYLEGARTHGESWSPGMVKAYLHQTDMPGVYNVEWIDAEFNTLNNELLGQIDSDGYLVITFPYQSSKMRFMRIK